MHKTTQVQARWVPSAQTEKCIVAPTNQLFTTDVHLQREISFLQNNVYGHFPYTLDFLFFHILFFSSLVHKAKKKISEDGESKLEVREYAFLFSLRYMKTWSKMTYGGQCLGKNLREAPGKKKKKRLAKADNLLFQIHSQVNVVRIVLSLECLRKMLPKSQMLDQ